MSKIVTKLNLNKTPQQVENNSLVFAKNIKLLKDASLSADSSFDMVFDSYISGKTEEELRQGYVGHIVGVNNVVYFFMDIDHTEDYNNVKIYKYYEETKELELINCGWHYSGGKITGCTTINNTSEEILTICEYFEDDDEDNPKVPIKHINITRCEEEDHSDDDETIYTQHPNLPISNLFVTGRYTCNIPNGVYQFFIRYKIRKDFYTPWIPCSKECYAGTPEVTSTIQGQIKNVNLHKDSAKSFIFRLHHCFTDVDWYESCQLGFILSHEDSAVARSWKHFDLDQDKEIYFDYDKNSIEEINIDDLTKTNFELFNVKNVCYYKNKEYITNYIETDFNPDLQEVADTMSCELDFIPLDDTNKVTIDLNDGNDPIEVDYPENGYITDNDLLHSSSPTTTIQDLLDDDNCISEVGTDEGSEHEISVVWKVKARFYYNQSTTHYAIWYWSKGEPKINYTDDLGTSHMSKYDFTYYDSENELEPDRIDEASVSTLRLLNKYENSGTRPYVYTTFYQDGSQGFQPSADERHKLAANLDNHDVDLMWYWAIGGYAKGTDETYDDVGGNRLQTLYETRGGSGDYKENPIDVLTGKNDSFSPNRSFKDADASLIDSGDLWFSIGNLYRAFGSKTLGNDDNKYQLSDRISSQTNPFTKLNGIETWKKQLKYILELNYPKCMIKRSYYYLSGETEPIYIDGDETWGVDNDDNLHGKTENDIDSYISSIRNTVLNKVVAVDAFGNCYAKVNELGDLSPNNVKVITQFGVEYIKFNYQVEASPINHGTDTEDLDGSDPKAVSTIDFTVSAKYTEYSKSYIIKCKKEIEEINKDYDYPTLMPFTKYEFYVHFVKQSGIATNGYKIGTDHIYDSYPQLGIIYPIFTFYFNNIPEEYTSIFFSYVKTKNNIAKCFNHRYEDGYHYVDCLECDLLLYNLDKNITIFREGDFDDETAWIDDAEYFSSGGTKYLPLFGNCGVLRWKGEEPDPSDTADDYFIYIKNDASNNEYKKLVKLTPYLLDEDDQDDTQALDDNNVPNYVANLNSPAHICGIKKLSHTSDIYYVTGNDVYNKTATGSEITVEMNSSILANIPSRMFYLPSNYNLNYINLSSDITPQIRKPSDDSNIDMIKQIVSYTNSLISSSITEHPSMYRDYPRKYYVPYEDEHIIVFNNTIRSSDVNTDELYRHIYTFEPEDYYNVPTNRGIVINLFQLSDFIYVHCQHALFKFTGSNTLHSDGGKVELKEGDVFDTGIKEVFDSQYGHAGLMYKHQSCVTFTAYFFYDGYSKQIYAYGGETQLANISDPIRKLLDDYKQDDIKFVADENNDRVFINLVKGETKQIEHTVPSIKEFNVSLPDFTINYTQKGNEEYDLNLINDETTEHRIEIVNQFYTRIPGNFKNNISVDNNQGFNNFTQANNIHYNNLNINEVYRIYSNIEMNTNSMLFGYNLETGSIEDLETNEYKFINHFYRYLLFLCYNDRDHGDYELYHSLLRDRNGCIDFVHDTIILLDAWIANGYTQEEAITAYKQQWNEYHGIDDTTARCNLSFYFLFEEIINLVITHDKVTIDLSDFSNICLTYNFKNKGYISIHDFDFMEGFGTRAYTYFVSQKYLPLMYIQNDELIAKYGWEINRIDRDVVRYTCYNGAYKPSDIGSPEYDDFTNPIERNIRNVYEELEEQLDQDNHQIVPSVIDVIMPGEYEKIKNLEYINWINALISNYGFNTINFAEEELDRHYPATKIRIYSDQCHTDLIQTVDEHNVPIISNDKNINDFKGQLYPRYNCGIWSLNAFRDIKNNDDTYHYEDRGARPRSIGYKYAQEDSLIYGKYFVVRLIYWNKKFKLENVEFKVNNYGKIS